VSDKATEMTFTTGHADELVIQAMPHFEDIEITAEPHGDACVSIYRIFLCDQGLVNMTCWNETLSVESPNAAFRNLESDQQYSYQLVAYGVGGGEIYIAPEGYVKTLRRIKAFVYLKEATHSSLYMGIDSNFFDGDKGNDLDDDKGQTLEWKFSLACYDQQGVAVASAEDVGESKTIVFEGLEAESRYECNGTFYADNQEVYIETLSVNTSYGVPDKVEAIVGNVDNNTLLVKWRPPTETRGRILEYRVNVSRSCTIDNLNCPDCFDESVFYVKDNVLAVPALPYMTYEVTVEARTALPTFSKALKPSKFHSPPAEPSAPVIEKVDVGTNNVVFVTYNHSCLLTGPTDITAVVNCSWCRPEIKKGRGNTLAIHGLVGGHLYQITLAAEVEGFEPAMSDPTVLFLDCEHRCRDGICLNRGYDVRCNHVRECPDGSDEEDCPCDPPLHFK
jgi:hypothetical protein